MIKRRRTSHTKAVQCEIYEKLKAGESSYSIAKQYEVSISFCNKLHYSGEKLKEKLATNTGLRNRKTVRVCDDEMLDAAVITWFQQASARGDSISGAILREKALELNEQLNLSRPPRIFKASNGWLGKFKKRHDIRYNNLKGEQLSNDSESEKYFSKFFQEKIQQENLCLENIYNADESGIYWRTLVSCALAQRDENTSEQEEKKDRITAMFCANASGSHRIPILVIGKSEIPQCLENLITPTMRNIRLKFLDSLGVIYTHQSNAWMDHEIFKLWYTEVFIPSVLEDQKRSGRVGKVILILDSAPFHSTTNELNKKYSNFEIVHLAPNITSNTQPMDICISLTKKLCKENLLRRTILKPAGTQEFLENINQKHCKENLLKRALLKPDGIQEFLNHMNLHDYLIILDSAWKRLRESTLNKVWKPLLGESFIVIHDSSLMDCSNNNPVSLNHISEETVTFPHDIANQISEALAKSDDRIEKLNARLLEWFETDEFDCGWEPLTDDQIVGIVTSKKEVKDKDISIQMIDTPLQNEIDEDDSTLDARDPLSQSFEEYQVVKIDKTEMDLSSPMTDTPIQNIIDKKDDLTLDDCDPLSPSSGGFQFVKFEETVSTQSGKSSIDSKISNFNQLSTVKSELDLPIESEERIEPEITENLIAPSSICNTSLEISTMISERFQLKHLCSVKLPNSWSITEFSLGGKDRLCLSFIVTGTLDDVEPVIERCILINSRREMIFKARRKIIDNQKFNLPQILSSVEKLPDILKNFQSIYVCRGLGKVDPYFSKYISAIEDCLNFWRHSECPVLLLKDGICNSCSEVLKATKNLLKL